MNIRTEDRVHVIGTNCYTAEAIDKDGKLVAAVGWDTTDGMTAKQCQDEAMKMLDAKEWNDVDKATAMIVTGSTDWGTPHEVAASGDLDSILKWRKENKLP